MSHPVFLPHLDEAVERECQTPHCLHDHGSAILLPPWVTQGSVCASSTWTSGRESRVPPWWGCDAGGVNVPWCRWPSPRALSAPRRVGVGARLR
jgi:hypothetical protein